MMCYITLVAKIKKMEETMFTDGKFQTNVGIAKSIAHSLPGDSMHFLIFKRLPLLFIKVYFR